MKDLKSLSLGKVLERSAAQVPDKIAVVDGKQRKTYTELNAMADALAAGLAAIGFKKGDRAAIYMKNSIELTAAFYALQKKGVIAVWVNPLYRKNEAEFILKNSQAKGAMITHYAAVRAGWEYSLGVQATSQDIFIGYLPMSHSYGCGSILIQPILLQATVVLMDMFEVETAFQLIEPEKITLQLAAPPHYILELNHASRPDYDLSSLRAGLIAGMIAPAGLITQVEKEMGVYLTSFWGASEVGPGLGTMCPFPSPLEIREKYIGKPISGARMRVVDPTTHEELEDGEIGELTLSGWHVMKGYWKNPEETKRQIIDGWLFMGDLASREKDGYIKIYGRTKDLINRGGYKIYPHELECMLIEHPKVEQVCIVATPNPVLGESICACVIPKPGQEVTLQEVRDVMKDKVAPHKLPDELCIMDDFPKLSGGVKIKKFGNSGLAELVEKDERRQRIRK